jgi:hypothetical protein
MAVCCLHGGCARLSAVKWHLVAAGGGPADGCFVMPPAWRPAGMKKGGQVLVGGLDITVSRNFFGAQVRRDGGSWQAGGLAGTGQGCLESSQPTPSLPLPGANTDQQL